MRNQATVLSVLTRILAPLLIASVASGFSNPFHPSASFRLARYHQSEPRTTALAAKSNKKSNVPAEVPANEFSRTLQPDRILKIKRDYAVTIEAEPVECEALAARFDLSEIDSLQADLLLRPELLGNRGSSIGGGVEVEGTCKATVTQRCVRTNEDFQMDLEFPLHAIVRPVIPLSVQLLQTEEEEEELYRKLNKQAAGTAKKTSYSPQNRNIDEMDVMELQKLLQFDIGDDDELPFEDESIYIVDGLMDVGELVAQLFWLKLDPYPKKPGTEPIQSSISG